MRKTVSRVDELGVHELVNDLLDANATYADIAAAVQQQTGQTISQSALSRYRAHWAQRKGLEAAKEAEVEALLRALAGGSAVQLDEAARGLLKKKLVQHLADAETTFDGADIIETGNLLVRALRLEQLQLQVQTQRERLELLKAKVAATADKVEAIGKAKGLDPETLRQIREDIYGLVEAPKAA